MSKSQKKICILVCLLILLIILCTFTHIGSIKTTKATSANSTDPQSVVEPVALSPIDFTIIKEDQEVSLKGNLDQQSHYDRLIAALHSTDVSKDVKIDNKLAFANEVISLTEKLLVPFMNTYQSGSICYQNGQLIVDGVVEREADKDQIATLLANSTIPSVDNTKVIEPVLIEPVDTTKVATPVEVNESNATAQSATQMTEVNSSTPETTEANHTLPKTPEANITLSEVAEVEVPKSEISEVEVPKAEVAQVKPEELQQIEAKIQEIIDFEDINFELNKATLTPKSLVTIKKIATILSENSSVKVEIAGHTDSTGDDEYNLKLSQERVDMVKKELMSLGIDKERMKAVGYGESRPLVSNDTLKNREKNRRVEFNIIGE